jgi:hypothetical protein
LGVLDPFLYSFFVETISQRFFLDLNPKHRNRFFQSRPPSVRLLAMEAYGGETGTTGSASRDRQLLGSTFFLSLFLS